MAILVLSDQDYSSGAKITGLTPATANGQPLTYEQLGGSVVNLATITVPALAIDWVQSIPVSGVTSSNTVQCWFAATSESDENELDLMQGMTVAAIAGTDSIAFCWSSPVEEIGAFKINYIVR